LFYGKHGNYKQALIEYTQTLIKVEKTPTNKRQEILIPPRNKAVCLLA